MNVFFTNTQETFMLHCTVIGVCMNQLLDTDSAGGIHFSSLGRVLVL